MKNKNNHASGKGSIWSRAFISIFIINLILNLSQFMTTALIPKYAAHLGATATIIGMVTSMFAITALGVRPIVGPTTSYFKKNQLLAVSTGIIILAFICYGLANHITVVVVGRLLHGIGMGFLAPLSLALASDALPESRIASGIGVFSMGQAIATAIGPLLGLELVQTYGYSATFFISAIGTSSVLILSLRLKTKAPERNKTFKISLYNIIAPEVIVPTVIMFFLAGAFSCINSFILIYGAALDVDEIGLFFTSYAIGLLFTRPISGKLSEKYGLSTTIIPGIIIFALSFIVISYSRSLPMFIVAGAISACGYGICQPSIQTLCMKLVSSDRRGVAGNTNYIGVDTGYLITPSLAGFIVSVVQSNGGSEVAGYAIMYQVMTIPILIALAIFLLKRKSLKEKEASSNLSSI
ncbi:putative MFS-type transporter YfcJ [Paenibacillus sp. JJ-100]|uniref:MFS transporter n=1 Tax=Paenibacillus sp. JJ-100 TaxID=2974896 RepID=UPI0022FF9652|nr:MFS transporter [Paenibacillus sp. JJ-100]CAI6048436.1 putative MFS-type transporter YfcJ [Paenibacillus sp. JJ-100]